MSSDTEHAGPSSRQSGKAVVPARAQPEFKVEPGAPLFVAKATLAAGVLGVASGATYGLVKRIDPFPPAVSMGTNFFVGGLAFFGTREYLVSPIIKGLRAQEGHEPSGGLWDVRTHRVPDSAISAGLAGGVLSLLFLPAAMTCALLATGGQFAVNEVKVMRLKYLARKEGVDLQSQGQEEKLTPAGSTQDVWDRPLDLTVSMQTPRKTEEEQKKRMGDSALGSRILEYMAYVIPIKKISDDEYLQQLMKKRDLVNSKISNIELEQYDMYEREREARAKRAQEKREQQAQQA